MKLNICAELAKAIAPYTSTSITVNENHYEQGRDELSRAGWKTINRSRIADLHRLVRDTTFHYSPIVWKSAETGENYAESKNFQQAHFLAFDLDKEPHLQMEAAVQMFGGCDGLVYTTLHHMQPKKKESACERYRLVLRTSRTLTLGEWERLQLLGVEAFGACPDCKDGARAFRGAGRTPTIAQLSGNQCVDVDAWLKIAESLIPPRVQSTAKTTPCNAADAPMVASALAVLDPDESESDWVRHGMAVKSALGDDGFSVWLDWSQKGEKFKLEGDRKARSRWDGFQNDKQGGVTVGTLIHDAELLGWKKPIPPSLQAKAASTGKSVFCKPEKTTWVWFYPNWKLDVDLVEFKGKLLIVAEAMKEPLRLLNASLVSKTLRVYAIAKGGFGFWPINEKIGVDSWNISAREWVEKYSGRWVQISSDTANRHYKIALEGEGVTPHPAPDWPLSPDQLFEQASRGHIVDSTSHPFFVDESGEDSSAGVKSRDPKGIYYDTHAGRYWFRLGDGYWIQQSCDDIRRLLTTYGISSLRLKGNPSDCDREIQRVVEQQHVDYAGALAGHRAGFYDQCGRRILVTSSPKIISPVKGEWPTIRTILTGLLGEIQLPFFLAWLKVAYESLSSGRLRTGQTVALVGPRDSGKSVVQNYIVTPILGGRVAKPYGFLIGRTNFNSEIFAAEHLMIEDESAAVDIKSRRTFGTALKDIAANEVQPFYKKHYESASFRPFWRCSLSVNEEPENLIILPPLDESLTDKIFLFKCFLTNYAKATDDGSTTPHQPMPMPAELPEDRQKFISTISDELPAFCQALLEWKIPDEIRATRFGVRAFHHPDLLAALSEMSPERRLLELIEACFPHGRHSWSATAHDIESRLRDGRTKDLERISHSAQSVGNYLARLQRQFPTRVSSRVVHGRLVWTILRYPPDTPPDTPPDSTPDPTPDATPEGVPEGVPESPKTNDETQSPASKGVYLGGGFGSESNPHRNKGSYPHTTPLQPNLSTVAEVPPRPTPDGQEAISPVLPPEPPIQATSPKPSL